MVIPILKVHLGQCRMQVCYNVWSFKVWLSSVFVVHLSRYAGPDLDEYSFDDRSSSTHYLMTLFLLFGICLTFNVGFVAFTFRYPSLFTSGEVVHKLLEMDLL